MDILKLVIVVLLSIAIGGLWWWRNKTVDKPELVKKPEEHLHVDVKPKKPELSTVHHDRLVLLGIINNNNMAVMKYGYPRQDIIFINENWTIDRIPPHVQLSKKDEEFVRRFLKRAEP